MPRFDLSSQLERDHAHICERTLFPLLFDHWKRADDGSATALYLQRDCKVDVVGVRGDVVKTLDEKIMDCFSEGRAGYAGNLIIETISNVGRLRDTGEKRYRGWWYTSAADYIAYVAVLERRHRAVVRCYELSALRALLTDTRLAHYRSRRASTDGGLYETEFHVVPARDLHGLVAVWEHEYSDREAAA